jgi:hypothetical protein
MKDKNLKKLKTALVGKTISDVISRGGHGMVLTLVIDTIYGARTVDICTYDDGEKHDVDEFYVALDGQEL